MNFSQDINTRVYHLDTLKFNELSYYYDTNSTIRHCVGLIERFIFTKLSIKGAKQHLNEYVELYFLPFFKNLLRNILLLGWCPYRLKKMVVKSTKERILVPEIVPVKYVNCNLEVNVENLTHEFKIYDLMSLQLKDNINVFTFTDIQLLGVEGLIHSIVSTTLPDFRYVQQLKKFTIQSEFNRSNPTIFLKQESSNNSSVNTFHNTQSNGFGMDGRSKDTAIFLDNTGSILAPSARNFANVHNSTSEAEIFENASSNMASNLRFHQNEMSEMYKTHQHNYFNIGLGYVPQWYNNLFMCPPNTTLAAAPRNPETRVDQLTMDRYLSSNIYQSFGIPESMIGNIGGNTQSSRSSTTRATKLRHEVNIMDLNSFESTIENFKTFFVNCFATLYYEIFNKKIDKKLIDFQPPELYLNYLKHVNNENIDGEDENENEKINYKSHNDSDESDDDETEKTKKNKKEEDNTFKPQKKQKVDE